MKSEERELEIPGDEDSNVGDVLLPKKREKKKKSREEKIAERKVIFWTLLIVVTVTFLFWFVPRIKTLSMPEINMSLPKGESPKQEMKNYVEYKL